MARANARSFQISDSDTEKGRQTEIESFDEGSNSSIMATAYICPMCVFNCDNLPDLEKHLEGLFDEQECRKKRIERLAFSSSRIECDSIAHQRTEAIQQSGTQ